ncbi:Protein kinase domain-containing protein [Cinnamomum micranthum f. kanehirae]|uniref:Protein kinase domain-containing protein n=1 Tax=Cinnamomum micranthum f. kanehirae TaxID=337451 RepID=A0A443N042_9MAGN|nr:Protein kinase domain-containing protein [Cinnamomum micranthum f. kanehirae]
MEIVGQLKRSISRQLSMTKSGRFSFRRQSSLEARRMRFSFGRQSSLDPTRRNPVVEELTVPENLDATMQLLFMASRGDAKGVEDLLGDGIDVNSIDLDGRTALHIAACEGHVDVVKLLVGRRANIDARDRWGSTAAADAKYYGNVEVYNFLKARGAKLPKIRKTPMVVSNPHEVPEYELNPLELQVRRVDGIWKACSFFPSLLSSSIAINGSYQVAKWNGTKVSVKILDKDSSLDPDSINAFKQELTLLQKVRHPNVVQFVGAVTQNLPMMIVSDYHAKGDLGSYLLSKTRLKPSKALRFALDIARQLKAFVNGVRGMNYLHECKPDPIIHCDLKPKNIFLDSGGQLKVAGFGSIKLSKLSPDRAKLAHGAQIDHSNLYIAPEVYRDEIFDRSVDTFSFGLILYEMTEGAQPLQPYSPEDAAKMICLEGARPSFKLKSKYYPPDLKEDFVSMMPKVMLRLRFPSNANMWLHAISEIQTCWPAVWSMDHLFVSPFILWWLLFFPHSKLPLKNYVLNELCKCLFVLVDFSIIPFGFIVVFKLIGECWDPEPLVRPTFSEIIVRLDRIFATCNKQGWWKDTFKLPWK